MGKEAGKGVPRGVFGGGGGGGGLTHKGNHTLGVKRKKLRVKYALASRTFKGIYRVVGRQSCFVTNSLV